MSEMMSKEMLQAQLDEGKASVDKILREALNMALIDGSSCIKLKWDGEGLKATLVKSYWKADSQADDRSGNE